MNPKATRRWKRKFSPRILLKLLLLVLVAASVAGLAVLLLQRWAQ